ncbi:hypothetical protein ACSSS7_008213 [Eimeria intestinalis]
MEGSGFQPPAPLNRSPSSSSNGSSSNSSSSSSRSSKISRSEISTNSPSGNSRDTSITNSSSISITNSSSNSSSNSISSSSSSEYYVPPPWGLTQSDFEALGFANKASQRCGPTPAALSAAGGGGETAATAATAAATAAGGASASASSAGLPHATLHVVRQGVRLESFSLQTKPFWIIGSSPLSTINYPHPCISRRHLGAKNPKP